MSSEAEYLREELGLYPPCANPHLLGHDAALADFAVALQADRLPHGWIIAGAMGIGKASFAYRLARSLMGGGRNTEPVSGLFGEEPSAAPMPDIDPESMTFRLIAAEAHPDLLTIAPEWDEKQNDYKSTLRVDEIRRIEPFFRRTASEGSWRICVVNQAQKMNNAAQNALLKILEEPPEKALLFLLTDRPGAFLPTIRSRCRVLPLRPLSDEIMNQLLDETCPDLTDEDRATLLKLAEGSIGRAIALHRHGGLETMRDLLSLLEGGKKPDVKSHYGFIDRMTRANADRHWSVATEGLIWWLREQAYHRARTENQARDWLNLWQEIKQSLAECDMRALDRKTVLDLALGKVLQQAYG